MRNSIVALATGIGLVVLASSAQAVNGCMEHLTQADCSAEKLCQWNTKKEKCKPAKAAPQSPGATSE
jgi:hypothetical protein